MTTTTEPQTAKQAPTPPPPVEPPPVPTPPPPAVPGIPAPPAPERPRKLRARTLDDKLSLAGAFAGSLGLTWLLYFHILPLFGLLGFIIIWYVVFLLMYAMVVGLPNPSPIVRDRVVSAAIHGGAILVAFALVTTVA